MVQIGQILLRFPALPLTLVKPIMKYAGVDIDIQNQLLTNMPDYVERLPQVISPLVADAFMYHATIDVFVLGRVKD